MRVSRNWLCPEGVCEPEVWVHGLAASAYGAQARKEKGVGAEQAWKEHIEGNSCHVGPAQCVTMWTQCDPIFSVFFPKGSPKPKL